MFINQYYELFFIFITKKAIYYILNILQLMLIVMIKKK